NNYCDPKFHKMSFDNTSLSNDIFYYIHLGVRCMDDKYLNTDLKIGSLFDGIGVFPLSASRYGITPTWSSEILKALFSITKRHYPNMLHLEDITKIDVYKIPPVHIITFGSPCQNLSNIGKQEDLAGSQSSLFNHAIRINEEMMCATNGIYPIIAVWE